MSKNMVLFFIVFLIIIVIIFSLVLFFSKTKKISEVCVGNNCFEVEVAENVMQQMRGLMFRKSLAENSGMFFVFDKEANYPFWMKNTLISLDTIWINKENKIVFISENTEPCKTFLCPQINPKSDAKYVLEINAGQALKLGIKVGDVITIK